MSDGDLVFADIANTPASVSELQTTDPEPLRQSNLWETTTTEAELDSAESRKVVSQRSGGMNHPLDFDVETDRIKLSLSDATDLVTGAATIAALLG